jgi:uncharacterized protein (TIGR02466 family)
MITSNIISLFPTAVLTAKLDREFTEDELKFFETVKNNTMPNVGNTSSTDTYVLNNKELDSLKSFFESQIRVYQDTITKPKNGASIYITQSWLNYSKPGDYHHRHKHPNSYISGVFYIQTNDNDYIGFDRDQYVQIEVGSTEFNEWNSHTWWLPAMTYQLYLFPSSLTHHVEKILGTQTRISLSFNTFVTGVLGEQDSFTKITI